MTPPSPLRWAALAVLSSLILTAGAFAQSTWITAGSGDWTNDTNWNPVGIPNAVDAVVIYTNSGYPVTNSLTDTNVTVGTINVFGSSSLILGNVPGTNDFLTLATSTGTPVINITNAANVVYIYAQLQGSNGFTKSGPGAMTFRFNTNGVHTYAGTINLNGGELGLNNDNSLGDSNNPVVFLANTVLNSAASTNGDVALNANRTITINSGATARLKNQTISNTLSVDGQITGGGALSFDGTGTGSNAATSLRYFINGTSNNYTGSTTVNGGAWVTLGSGATLGTNALSLSGGASTNTAFTVDLGGTTQNFGNLTVGSSTVYVRTITVSNGTLNITNPTGAFSFNGTNGTIWSMSNAATFTFLSGGTPRNFTIQPSTGGITNTSGVVTNIVTDNTNTMFFARSSNQVTAITNRIGGATGPSAGNNHMARVFLGTNNTFNSVLFEIGAFNGMGTVDFMADVTDGAVRLRGTNGTAAMPQLIVGNTSSGSRRGSGTINLGVADALVTNTLIGNMQANSATNLTMTSSVVVAGGQFASTNLYIGVVTNPANSGNVFTNVTIFQQNGGISSIGLVRMGDNRSTNTNNTISFQASYNLSSSNAVLRAAAIDAGTNAIFGAGSLRKINFGAGRIETLDTSTDLTISGFNTTAAGRIEIAVASNAQTKTFFADTNRKITLEPSAVLTFDGGITKDGAGTLVLKGTNVHKGNTTVAAGTLELQSTGSLAFEIGGSGTNNQLNGPGTASLDGKFAFNLASASTNTNSTWTIVSNSLSTTYGTNFVVTGFNGAGGNWTNTTNGVNYVFAQSNGVLSVQSTGAPSPYSAWIAYWQGVDPAFTNTAGTDNPDGDPFDNNEEFAFDGNPTIGTGALLVATKAGTNTVFNYVALTNTNTATYQVQNTTNLSAGPWTNSVVTISNSTNQTGINLTNDYVRKEFVVPGTNNDFYRVRATLAQ
jgi:fibronectin-binding autotransporter adhesin